MLDRTARIMMPRTAESNMLHALHAPEIKCIFKGKARTPDESGVKVTNCDHDEGGPGRRNAQHAEQSIRRSYVGRVHGVGEHSGLAKAGHCHRGQGLVGRGDRRSPNPEFEPETERHRN